jgi:hypothetical protein
MDHDEELNLISEVFLARQRIQLERVFCGPNVS